MEKAEKTDVDSRHVERTTTEERLDTLARRGSVKVAKVQSVALVDAVAKDNHSNWTPSMFKLYGIMAFCVLSK
jgi:hypothetical protein